MPFTNPETGQEFADFGACVSEVMEWDGVESEEQAKQMCGAWQAQTKGNIYYNASDPTESSRIRKNWQDDLQRRLESVSESVTEWFERNGLDYATVRVAFTDWLERQLQQTVLEPANPNEVRGGRHWTGTFIRRAYRRGLELARRDLESIEEYTSIQIRQATRSRSDAHQQHLTREYNQAYAGLRDQMSRAMDRIGAIVREAVNDERNEEWLVGQVTDHIGSDMVNAARAHANTIVVSAVNEALLVSFEEVGVERVGVAPETEGSDAETTNYIRTRLNDELPDPADPRNPDEAQWVTAGDSAVCPICEALEGTIVKIENVRSKEQFQPPVHPNCRCRLVPLPPGRGE